MKKIFVLKTQKAKLYWGMAKLGFMVSIPIYLFLMPADYFDVGQSICISKLLFHQECYACGITKACMHLIHLDIAGAYYYNMMSFIVMPITSIMWLLEGIKEWKLIKLLLNKTVTKAIVSQ